MRQDKRQVPTGQKESLELKLKNRLAYLSEKGTESPAIDKDSIVKHLKADIRAINARLKAIDALEKKDEELAKRKLEKKSAPPEASAGTKKKKGEAAPVEGKEKKKKKE